MNINDLQEAIFANLTLGKLENHITTFRHTRAALCTMLSYWLCNMTLSYITSVLCLSPDRMGRFHSSSPQVTPYFYQSISHSTPVLHTQAIQ